MSEKSKDAKYLTLVQQKQLFDIYRHRLGRTYERRSNGERLQCIGFAFYDNPVEGGSQIVAYMAVQALYWLKFIVELDTFDEQFIDIGELK